MTAATIVLCCNGDDNYSMIPHRIPIKFHRHLIPQRNVLSPGTLLEISGKNPYSHRLMFDLAILPVGPMLLDPSTMRLGTLEFLPSMGPKI